MMNTSKRLYDVLELVGASEEMRLKMRRLTTEAEILDTLSRSLTANSNRELQRQYYVGSYYESSATPSLYSDIDTLYVEETVLVLTDIRTTTHEDRPLQFLLIRDEGTYPGHVKLQLLQGNEPLNDRNTMGWTRPIYNEIFPKLSFSVDQHGNVCLENNRKLDMSPYKFKQNGPALAIYTEIGKHDFDDVFVYEIDKIPAFAKDWLSRRRKYGWPSQDMLTEMSQMPCFVAAKNHHCSTESKLEWRLSFTLQERRLMRSLNPVQHKVYVLLKIIKWEIVQKNKDIDGVISSYELKTCVFYVIENTPARYWVKNNLLNCLLYTLHVFTGWIRNAHCPNFFIPDQNLFSKASFKHKRSTLTKILQRMLQEKHRLVFSLHCDSIGELMTYTRDTRGISLLLQADYELETHKRQLVTFLATKLLDCSRHVVFAFRPSRPNHIRAIETSVVRYDRLMEYTEEEKRYVLPYIRPWVHLQVAKAIACKPESFDHADDQMTYHFDQAHNMDALNQKLIMATVHLSCNDLSVCLKLLEELDTNIYKNTNLCTFCGCRYIPSNGAIRCAPPSRITVEANLKERYAYCITFMPSETKIVPAPLHLESHRSIGSPPITDTGNFPQTWWYDKIAIDSKIYCYFLLYLVHKKLGNETEKCGAIKKLHYVLRTDVNLTHTETAYNVLGWIYAQEELFGIAARCFMMSWDYQQTHNAVKFHVWDLMKHLRESRREILLQIMRNSIGTPWQSPVEPSSGECNVL